MNYPVLALLFILAGFFMKYSDDFYDEDNNTLMASILGVVCGIACACASVISADAACIFIGILVGNLLAFKVDGIHHVITLLVFVVICLICGLPQLSLVILLACIFGALADEVGHEMISNITDNRFANLFFEYRFMMKVVLLLLVICGVFSFWTFICFLLFEAFYLVGGIVFEKLS